MSTTPTIPTAVTGTAESKESTMNDVLKDSTGEEVTVELDEPGLAYVIKVADGEVAGRAHYLVGENDENERIFYHTVVDEKFGGRGLSKILVAEALADCREKGLTVVAICPLFVKKLRESGDDYIAEGGKFRNPTAADFVYVEQNA